MKQCTKCQKLQPIENFNKRASAKDGLAFQCKECNKANLKVHYNNNKQKYLTRNKKRLAELRNIIAKAKSVPCVDCKINYPPYVMDFDHLDNKEFVIAAFAQHTSSKAKLLNEINKCDVVCSNCHRERTHQRKQI